MEEGEMEAYLPDFSDFYDESFQFWDFMSQKVDDGNALDTIPPKRDESLQGSFWDFFNSRIENVPHSPESCHIRDFLNSSDDKVEASCSTIPEARHDIRNPKSSACDEFWDFLNSSAEDADDRDSEERQLRATDTASDISEQSNLPRISSVFSIPDYTPQISSSLLQTAVCVSNSGSTIPRSRPAAEVTEDFQARAGTSRHQDSDKKCGAAETARKVSSVPKYSARALSREYQALEPKRECEEKPGVQNTIVTAPIAMPSVCLNSDGTTCVLLPSIESSQNPHFPQYLIIVNNAAQPTQPAYTSNSGDALADHQRTTADLHKCSVTKGVPVDQFERDLRLAGFRNNHVLNVRKKSLESSPFVAPNHTDEGKCLLPVSSAPLDGHILNSISTRIKCDQNSKQTSRTTDCSRRKPIKCIPLGRCKRAIQQTNVPVSLEASEAAEWNACGAGTHSPTDRAISGGTRQVSSSLPAASRETDPSSGAARQDLWGAPGYLLVSARAAPPPPATAKVLILQEARPKKPILPKPPSLPTRDKKSVPKEKRDRRKTVKELLQERQLQFRHAFGGNAEVPSPVAALPTSDPTPASSSEGPCILPHEKSFRPRHYDMSELQIGFLKVQEDVDACGRFRSKFKVLFMKRQFLYDFPVCQCNQPGLRRSGEEWGGGGDEMARIAVPFATITAISLRDRTIYLSVDSAPRLSLLGEEGDSSFWGHFLRTSFSHKVVLRKRQASKLKAILCQFDDRFIALTDIVPPQLLTSHDGDLLSPASFKRRSSSKSRKWGARTVPPPPHDDEDEDEEGGLLLNRMCSCRTHCRSIRCSCVKAAKSCSAATCRCTNCNNPLNVLEMMGLDVPFSLRDACLFHNIYQIPDLSNYLLREVRLECCNSVARVQDCIPGAVLCPNCDASLEYSWCQKRVSYPERNPRNHCSFCGQCCFANGRHCHVCKKCYAVTSKSSGCPTCPEENPNTRRSDAAAKPPPQIILLDRPLLKET